MVYAYSINKDYEYSIRVLKKSLHHPSETSYKIEKFWINMYFFDPKLVNLRDESKAIDEHMDSRIVLSKVEKKAI